MPTFEELASIFLDEIQCMDFLLQCGALDHPGNCHSCGGIVRLESTRGSWRCSYSACRKEVSIRRSSFFGKSRLPLRKILLIAYLWLNRVPQTSAVMMTGCSSGTITDYYGHLRQLAADSLDEVDCKVGGPGIIVEVDESKFGKRKYNRGHRVEGVWVVGGVERTPEKKVFACKVEKRDAETLRDVISRFVLPGSIIYSDMWRGYDGLEEALGLMHRTVNHSVEFVSSDGVHTNTVEATWCGMKVLIPKRNRTKQIDEHLWEYIWRKLNREDLWSGFLKALSEVSYQ